MYQFDKKKKSPIFWQMTVKSSALQQSDWTFSKTVRLMCPIYLSNWERRGLLETIHGPHGTKGLQLGF